MLNKGKLNTLADVISRLNELKMLTKLYEMLPFDRSCIEGSCVTHVTCFYLL